MLDPVQDLARCGKLRRSVDDPGAAEVSFRLLRRVASPSKVTDSLVTWGF